jgi:hypothetical protein
MASNITIGLTWALLPLPFAALHMSAADVVEAPAPGNELPHRGGRPHRFARH